MFSVSGMMNTLWMGKCREGEPEMLDNELRRISPYCLNITARDLPADIANAGSSR